MGQSNSVIILFQGRRVPSWVRYGCVETRCFLHKKKREYCENCGNLDTVLMCVQEQAQRDVVLAVRATPNKATHVCPPVECVARVTNGSKAVQEIISHSTQGETHRTIRYSQCREPSPAQLRVPPLETPRARSRSRDQSSSRSRTPRRVARSSRSRSRLKARHSVGWSEVVAGHPKTKPTSRTEDKTSTKLTELKAMVENLQDTVA
ncbi:hypothetical protein HPB47_019836 [Ixodes persulcatus]|uniref:Uncharacterized protein n=1 Tax=Ixodes persulcatus TaxID=34615 RepID=A0AC60QJL2_IXOPE|nr:hypothetical protein HPB47_019836 [Ixodes persulcatus]